MKPNDANGKLPPERRPFRVLLIAGSNRRQYDCPGIDSKARALMFRMGDRLPQEWEIDLEDLGNVWNREQIRSCNGCVSTSMALCVWPCNCYEKGHQGQPDLMWNLDLYARLDLADAWAIIGPVNWYAASSNLKAMFDRLVCMNGGNPREDLIGHKDPALAIELEHSAEWETLSQNHLEGRSAAFFCYGDGGGDELTESGRPKLLRHRSYFDAEQEPFGEMRNTYAPLVWQCRYSGIEVPTRCGATPSSGAARNTATTRRSTWPASPSCSAALMPGATPSRATSPAKAKFRPAATAPTATGRPPTSAPISRPSGGGCAWPWAGPSRAPHPPSSRTSASIGMRRSSTRRARARSCATRELAEA